MHIWYCSSSVGPLCLTEEDGFLTGLHFCAGAAPAPEALPCGGCPTPLLAEAERQLNEYFAGARTEFDLPLRAQGTDFQKAVWAELRRTPYGQTRTYGQLAAALGRPKASRAVGGACHCNPIAILVPCHRVIGASGALTGLAGGLEVKRSLMELEQAVLPGEPV